MLMAIRASFWSVEKRDQDYMAALQQIQRSLHMIIMMNAFCMIESYRFCDGRHWEARVFSRMGGV